MAASGRSTRLPAAWALVCALTAPAAAAGPVPASEALEGDLKGIRAQTQNMRMKVKRSVVAMAEPVDPAEGAPEVTGWARQCCVDNVVVMHRRLVGFERILRGLDRLYREGGRQDGARLTAEMLADVDALRRRLGDFAAAPDQTYTHGVIQNMIRVVAMLNRHHRELAECCDDVRIAVEPPRGAR